MPDPAHCPACDTGVLPNRTNQCPWCDTTLTPPPPPQRLVDSVARASLCAQEIMNHPDLIYGVTG